jgi:oligosaccharide repeat unit polymerase
MLVGLLIGLMLVFSRGEPSRFVSSWAMFLALLGAWYAGELCVFPTAIAKYDSTDIRFAVLCVVLCLTGFCVGYWRNAVRGSPDRTPWFTQELGCPDRLWTVFVVSMFLGCVPLIWIARGNLLAVLQDAFLPQKRWSSIFQRARYGDLRDAFLELQMFLRAAVPLACAIVFADRGEHSIGRRLLAGSLLLYVAARALNSGARLSVIEVFLPLAAAVFWRSSRIWKRRLITAGLPLAACIAFLWSTATCVGRDEGRFEWSMAFQAEYTGFEMFRELLFLTTRVPEAVPYQSGYTYYVQFINPIPRFSWSEKPRRDAGLLLAELQNQTVNGEPKLTIAPGLIGEMYWNFGMPGIVLLSILIGWIAAGWDHWGRQQSACLPAYAVYVSGLGILFMSGRSINISNFYGLLALAVVTTLVRFWHQMTKTSKTGDESCI